jgi:hypothetical protein
MIGRRENEQACACAAVACEDWSEVPSSAHTCRLMPSGSLSGVLRGGAVRTRSRRREDLERGAVGAG